MTLLLQSLHFIRNTACSTLAPAEFAEPGITISTRVGNSLTGPFDSELENSQTMKRKLVLSLLLGGCALLIALFLCLQFVRSAAQAYIFGYPLVLMDLTRDGMAHRAEPNGFMHNRVFPDHTFRQVVRPNNDTLYSIAWLDLAYEPVVLTVPDMGQRYYVMPLMDAWSNVFARIGTGTTGSDAGSFVISGPEWRGSIPQGLKQVRAPTNRVWIIGRIQTNGAGDIAQVSALQAGFKLSGLEAWSRGESTRAMVSTAAEKPSQGDPYQAIVAMSGQQFFTRMAMLIGQQAPAADDAEMLDTLASIGMTGDQPFNPGRLAGALLNFAKQHTHEAVTRELARAAELENGWAVRRNLIGTYGTHYGVRAGVAMVGLGALPPEEAVYPKADVDGQGAPLNGANRYRIRFNTGQLPPNAAFWSVTMYDEQGFLVENSLARYAIGDRDALVFNPDGSLDLLVQHRPPAELLSNWLPAPEGNFSLTLRIYLPGESFLDGSWIIPPIERLADPGQ